MLKISEIETFADLAKTLSAGQPIALQISGQVRICATLPDGKTLLKTTIDVNDEKTL